MDKATAELIAQIEVLQKRVDEQQEQIDLLINVLEKISPGTIRWHKIQQGKGF